MIEWYNNKEFMKAPVELHSVIETQDILGPRGNVLMQLAQEQSIVLHIGDHDYDVRDLVHRLLRTECDVRALMETVADLQTKIGQLESKIYTQEVKNDYTVSALESFVKGEWKIKLD